jgi:hypothetical protein
MATACQSENTKPINVENSNATACQSEDTKTINVENSNANVGNSNASVSCFSSLFNKILDQNKIFIKSRNKLNSWIGPQIAYKLSRTLLANAHTKLRDKILKAISIINNAFKFYSIDLEFVDGQDLDETNTDTECVFFEHHTKNTEAIIGKEIKTNRSTIWIASWILKEEQPIRLILHEIMHVLGFEHEHQRYDVIVKLSNPSTSSSDAFIYSEILKRKGISLTPYDKKSIMKYNEIIWHNDTQYKLELNSINENSLSEIINKIFKQNDTRSATTVEDATIPTPVMDERQSQQVTEERLKEDNDDDWTNVVLHKEQQAHCLMNFNLNKLLNKVYKKSNWELFSKWDIYALQLLYGKPKCIASVRKGMFYQTYILCTGCDKKLCLACAIHHFDNCKNNAVQTFEKFVLKVPFIDVNGTNAKSNIKLPCTYFKLEAEIKTNMKNEQNPTVENENLNDQQLADIFQHSKSPNSFIFHVLGEAIECECPNEECEEFKNEEKSLL